MVKKIASMIRQGELVEIDIEDVSSDGNGVGKIDSQVVFIPHTVTGDRISAKLIKVKKKICRRKTRKSYHPFTTSYSPPLHRGR